MLLSRRVFVIDCICMTERRPPLLLLRYVISIQPMLKRCHRLPQSRVQFKKRQQDWLIFLGLIYVDTLTFCICHLHRSVTQTGMRQIHILCSSAVQMSFFFSYRGIMPVTVCQCYSITLVLVFFSDYFTLTDCENVNADSWGLRWPALTPCRQ